MEKLFILENLIQKVYNQSTTNNNKKVFAIGDNLNTDIKGANLNMNFDSLLISNGVHKEEIKRNGIQKILLKYKVDVDFFTKSNLKW